jgi:NADPH:quinone reductase-like Zn-dependent oxidoreductase
MRAAVVDGYGPPEVVRVVEVPRPVPARDEVLVRVEAVAVTSGDARIRGARFPPGFGVLARLALGIRRPRRAILGSTLSGVVETVGRDAGAFAPGDEVCAMTGTRMGAHAEFVAVPVGRLARKPSGVTHDDAAGSLFGGTAALYFLRDRASVGSGTSVLVNGASGAVGTSAVQLARYLGARVTGVTRAANAELVTHLGAERVIDHTRIDVTGLTDRFDVVLDAVGNLTITSGRRLLTADGVLVLAVASLGDQIRARGDVVAGSAPERVEDFDHLLRLLEAGDLTVVHDATFALDDIVEAHRRVDSGHKVGNIVVRP